MYSGLAPGWSRDPVRAPVLSCSGYEKAPGVILHSWTRQAVQINRVTAEDGMKRKRKMRSMGDWEGEGKRATE